MFKRMLRTFPKHPWRSWAISACAATLLTFNPSVNSGQALRPATFDLQPSTFNLPPANLPPAPHPYPITFGSAASTQPAVSADGRFIAFTSTAADLVPADTNQAADIFVYDRQSTRTERISVASDGAQANAFSARPAISADGRVVAFESLASNLSPGDTNASADIFVHDRLTGETSRVSVNIHGEEANGWSEAASISGNGRWVTFLSTASNLFPGDANGLRDAFLYDRLTGLQQRISIGPNGEDADGETYTAAINALGTGVVFISSASNLVATDTDSQPDVFLYSLGDFRTRLIAPAQPADLPSLSAHGLWVSYLAPTALQDGLVYVDNTWEKELLKVAFSTAITQQALSGDGQNLVAVGTPDGETFSLYQHILSTGKTNLLADGVSNTRPAISSDGQVIAFVRPTDGVLQIQVADLRANPQFTYTIHGRVIGPLGDPLAQVQISDGRGHATETDHAGRFFLSGLPAGKVTLTPSKTGFTFEPASTTLNLSTDTGDIQFTYAYGDVLKEARLDIGMPYDHRCEDGPACQGAFHGFAAGQCTDLVLDAFTWGAEYNFKLALWRDAQAHPEHIYQTGNARDAYDLWRYFSYTGQMLPNDQPYQVGDLVFFDWAGDGEINHVSLVSQVDKDHQPTFMVDATGVIASNPGGLAAELPWEIFHENSVRGHARWNGIRQPPVVGVQPVEVLQVAVGSSGVRLRLWSLTAGKITPTRSTLPGGWFFDLAWEQNLSVLNPLSHGRYYFVLLDNPTTGDLPYYFVAQTRQNWEIGGMVMFTGTLLPGQTRLIPLRLTADGGLALFNWSAPRNSRPRR
jgi:Tol biopolymer transport system component